MNIEDFLAILRLVLDNRASLLTGKSGCSFDGVELGPNHAAFDICCVGKVLDQVKRSGLTGACPKLHAQLEEMLTTVDNCNEPSEINK